MEIVNALKYAFLAIYLGVVLMVVVYGLHRYWLVMIYLRNRRKKGHLPGHFDELPTVTVQLPVYNEQYVVERLIQATCGLDYPREKLEIQVLDDSTDETVSIARDAVTRMRARGHNIVHVHREDREGFKAGALQKGLEVASGEFVAIFDADFIPSRDMLRRTIHHFTDPAVGLVQTRWGHVNEDYSLLTRSQGIFLDGHFIIEHVARNRSGRFMSFNGTAGVWRRKAIEDAGGWHHDTLTEDLDLSYRAQLAGYQFVYLPGVVSPAELPVEMNAFKSQQHRWTKGMVQTAIKMLPTIFRSNVPLKVKIEAFFHMTCATVYGYVFLMTLLLLPAIALPFDVAIWNGGLRLLLIDMPLFMLASLSASVFYLVSQYQVRGTVWRTVKFLPFLMCIGIGISVINTKAILEALVGHRSPFIRTPKFGVQRRGEGWSAKKYRVKPSKLAIVELSVAAYVGVTMVVASSLGYFASLPFLSLFFAGYLYVGILSLKHAHYHSRTVSLKAAGAAA